MDMGMNTEFQGKLGNYLDVKKSQKIPNIKKEKSKKSQRKVQNPKISKKYTKEVERGFRGHNFVCQKMDGVPNTMFLTPENPKNPMPWALAQKKRFPKN